MNSDARRRLIEAVEQARAGAEAVSEIEKEAARAIESAARGVAGLPLSCDRRPARGSRGALGEAPELSELSDADSLELTIAA